MCNLLAGESRHSLAVQDQTMNWYTAMREILIWFQQCIFSVINVIETTVQTDYVKYDLYSYSTKRGTKKCKPGIPQNIFLTQEAIVAKAVFKSNLN